MTDIVDRLRREGSSQLGTRILDPLMMEAADEIERLRTEVERYRTALEEYACTGADHPCGCYDQFLSEKTEIERLKAMLEVTGSPDQPGTVDVLRAEVADHKARHDRCLDRAVKVEREIDRLRAEAERFKLVVEILLPYVEAHTDAGPVGEGWKSEELVMALNAARAVLGREKF